MGDFDDALTVLRESCQYGLVAFVEPFVLENILRSSRRQLSDNHAAFRKQSVFTYFTGPFENSRLSMLL